MSALGKMTLVEAKLFKREPMSVFWGLAFPALLLLILGFAFPGFREPSPDLDGFRLVDLYAPIVIALALMTSAFLTLPVVIATYRQLGVLRRLSTTPIGAGRMVAAQLILQVGVAVVAVVLTVVIATLAFDMPIPRNLPGFFLVVLLGAASMLAIGLLIGAVAPRSSTAQGLGMAIYFPMLFLAGVYFPRQAMPDGLRRVSDFSPAGAVVQALGDTWGGGAPSNLSLLVMAGSALVAGFLAVLAFRWE